MSDADNAIPANRMELDKALRQIEEIRLQMARAGLFRGYRSVTVGLTGVVGIAAAALQAPLAPDPAEQVGTYLALWMGSASLCMALVGVELAARCWRRRSVLTQQMTWTAIEQLLPALVAGVLLTLVLVRSAPQSVWMLPGLWQIVFGLGIFASCRFMPRPLCLVGMYYLASGAGSLSFAQGDAAFTPWAMAIGFGGGQLLAAALLYWTLERADGKT